MAITPLATVEDIADRIGEEITERGDVRMAASFLRLVSAQVRAHGAAWPDPIVAPEVAIAITIEAAARGYLNPEGFDLERGDEITFQRDKVFAVGSTLTDVEIKTIRAAAGKTGIWSVQMVRDVTVDPSHAGLIKQTLGYSGGPAYV